MAEMIGNDPDALDGVAGELRGIGSRIDSKRGSLTSRVMSSPWEARSADQFRSRWNAEYARALSDAVRFLNDAAGQLNRNAQDQRAVSEAGAGGPGSHEVAAPKPEKSELEKTLEEFSKWLERLGIPMSAIATIIETLEKLMEEGKLSPAMLKMLADNDGLITAFKALDKAISVVSAVTDFVTDFAAHGDLPFDERIIHAVAKTALNFAIDTGIDKAMTWVGGTIGSALPVAGTAAGAAIGWILGQAASAGFGWLDDKFHITDGGADGITNVYKYAKEHDFNLVEIQKDLGGKIVDGVVDGAQNFAGDVADGAQEIAGGLADGAQAAYDKVTPW